MSGLTFPGRDPASTGPDLAGSPFVRIAGSDGLVLLVHPGTIAAIGANPAAIGSSLIILTNGQILSLKASPDSIGGAIAEAIRRSRAEGGSL